MKISRNTTILKNWLRMRYLDFLNLLHRPLRRPTGQDPFHQVYQDFMALTWRNPEGTFLEIGPGKSSRRADFSHMNSYSGFDIRLKEGVDRAGDVHELSRHYPKDSVDFILAVSVMEHLLFPWKAVIEMNHILKPGGVIFCFTHPLWPAHEMPWDFWRFPGSGLSALFHRHTGFEILQIKEGLPVCSHALVDDVSMRKLQHYVQFAGVSVMARKIGGVDRDRIRWDVPVTDVLDSVYPE